VAEVDAGNEPGVIDSLLKLSRSLVAHARMRLQLLGLELEQEKQRIFVALLATLFAYLFLSVTLVLAALAVVIHFWDTPDRLASVVFMAIGALVVTIGCVLLAVVKLSTPSTLFHASLAELVDDEAALADHAVHVVAVAPVPTYDAPA
jgi:uncharacterized membrane protein YqjE